MMQNGNNEIWIKCKDASKYMISSFGKVVCLYNLKKKGLPEEAHEISGVNNSCGYKQTYIQMDDGIWRRKLISRLVFFSFHPNIVEDKSLDIDHIDGNKSNNVLSNLRCITHAENLRNRAVFAKNSYGITGLQVRHYKRNGKPSNFRATLTCDGVMFRSKWFENLADARTARLLLEAMHFKQFGKTASSLGLI